MMRVLSDVFPPEIPPVRDGWYLTRQLDGAWFWALIEWRDSKWICPVRMGRIEQRRFWQGIAFDPAGAVHDGKLQHVGKGMAKVVYGVFVPGAQCC